MTNENNSNFNIKLSDWLEFLEHQSSSYLHMNYSYIIKHIMVLGVLLSFTLFISSIGDQERLAYDPFFMIFKMSIIIYFSVLVGTNFLIRNRYMKLRVSAEKILYDILVEHKYQSIDKIEHEWEKNFSKYPLFTQYIFSIYRKMIEKEIHKLKIKKGKENKISKLEKRLKMIKPIEDELRFS